MGFTSVAFLALVMSSGAAIFLLATLTLSPKHVRAAHGPLWSCIFCLTYSTVVILSHPLGFWERLPGIFSIPAPFSFLFPPSLYCYIVKLTKPRHRFGRTGWLHLLPFLLCLFVLWPVLTADSQVRWSFLQTDAFSLPWFVTVSLFASTTLYLISALRVVQVQQLAAERSRSSLELFRFELLRLFITAFGLTWLMVLTLSVSDSKLLVAQFGIIILSPLLPAFVILTLRCSPVFRELSEELKVIDGEAGLKPQYATSGLSTEEVFAIAKKMDAYIVSSRCFLNSNLKLEHLARALRITEYQTSQVINVGLRESFFSLINRYRIDEAKERLVRSEYYSNNILQIAYDVGFNSKSAFNTAFRKRLGTTPSEFRRAAREASPVVT